MDSQISEIRRRQRDWLIGFIGKYSNGRVPFAAAGNLFSPGRESGLSSSVFALKACVQTGVWKQLDTQSQSEWIEHLKAFQSKKGGSADGFFRDEIIDPVRLRRRLSYRFRRRAGEMPPRMSILLSETRQALAVLESVSAGSGEIPERVLTEDIVQKKALEMNDGDPWATLSQLSHLAFLIKLAEKRQSVMDSVVSCLTEQLIKRKGLVSRNIQARFGTAAASGGAMKLIILSETLGIELAAPDFLIDAALSCPDMADACQFLNPLVVLNRVGGSTIDYKKQEILKFQEKRLAAITIFQMSDGGFAFTPTGSTTNYLGVRVTRGLRVGDVHGAHILGWALCLLEKALVGQSPWLEPPT